MSSDQSPALTLDEIQTRIPHRPPMLLVDKVLELSSDRILCQRHFRADEFFFQGHYPDHPLVPGVILCEACMQAGAILLSDVAEGQGVPVATRMNDVRFKQMVHPNETVSIEATLTERVSNAFFMKAKMTRDGKLVMRLEFACTLAPPESS